MKSKLDKQLRLASYALYESGMMNMLSALNPNREAVLKYMENDCMIAKMKWYELSKLYAIHRKYSRYRGAEKPMIIGHELFKNAETAKQELLFKRLFKMKLNKQIIQL